MKLSNIIKGLINESEENFKRFITDPKRLARLEAAIKIIEAGEKDKTIWNTDFEEAKSDIKNTFYYSNESVKKEAEKLVKGADDAETFRVNMIHAQKDSPVDAVRYFKEGNTLTFPPAKFYYDSYVVPFESLYKRLLALKSHIVKGRKPNPNAVKAPVFKPSASAGMDIIKVKDIYEELLKDWYPKQVEAFKEYFQEGIDIMQELIDSKPTQSVWLEKENKMITSKYFTRKTMSAPYELRANYKQIIDKESEGYTKQTQNAFINKNLKKLTSIISAKGGLKSATVKNIRSYKGTISGEIIFVFEDNAQFTVRNQVVSVWGYGKMPFHRFPTTFHDVVLPDGTKKKMMPEKDMNQIFAGIKG